MRRFKPRPPPFQTRPTHLNETKADVYPGAAADSINVDFGLVSDLVTMEKGFLKSTLPAHDASVLNDSSLALPAEPTRRSPSQVGPNERSVRVHQQVQLTLARRARRTVPNGKVRFLVVFYADES